MKKYFLMTVSQGCPPNLVESASFRKILDSNNFGPTESHKEADVIIINTCGALDYLQKIAKDACLDMRQRYPEKKIIVSGCYPMVSKDLDFEKLRLDVFPPGSLCVDKFCELMDLNDLSKEERYANIIDPRDMKWQPPRIKSINFLHVIERFLKIKIQPAHNFFKAAVTTPDFHYVTVGQGCLGKCTYCTTKFAKGRPQSNSIEEIIADVKKGVQQNRSDIWIVADDLSCWGHDIGLKPSVLLKEILSLDLDFELAINHFGPGELVRNFDELKESFYNKKVIQVNLPLQTGSQKVLERMKRYYPINEVIACIKDIRKKNPDLLFKTNFIVGFPGETWSDFFQSIKAMQHFDAVGVNLYARMKGTLSYDMEQVPYHVMFIRRRIINLFVHIQHSKVMLKSILILIKRLIGRAFGQTQYS